jgi:hypothetical protein
MSVMASFVYLRFGNDAMDPQNVGKGLVFSRFNMKLNPHFFSFSGLGSTSFNASGSLVTTLTEHCE